MDLLAIILTVALNRSHLCIHHKDGEWHTHVPGRCACVVHLAHMGDMTFITLKHIPKHAPTTEKRSVASEVTTGGTAVEPDESQSSAKDPTPPPLTVNSPCSDNRKPKNMVKTPNQDVLRWVHCTPHVYPPSISKCYENQMFMSEKQLAEFNNSVTSSWSQGEQKIFRSANTSQRSRSSKKGRNGFRPKDNVSLSELKKGLRPKRMCAQKAQKEKEKETEAVVGIVTEGHICHKYCKSFTQKYNLTKHMYIHKRKQFKCPKCDYKTGNPYHLTEHTAKCVDGLKFECAKCKQVFNHRMQLY